MVSVADARYAAFWRAKSDELTATCPFSCVPSPSPAISVVLRLAALNPMSAPHSYC